MDWVMIPRTTVARDSVSAALQEREREEREKENQRRIPPGRLRRIVYRIVQRERETYASEVVTSI
jgi:hypothetical protein